MANRRFGSQFTFGFERMPVRLVLKVAYGASGAPTLDSNDKQGIASMTRTSAGLYEITLQDVYNRLLDVHVQQQSAAAQAAPIVNIVSEAVASTKKIVLQYRAIDNTTATDPANGESAYIQILLSNSSVTK